MEVKWRKLPSPEKLATLPAVVQSDGVSFLQAIAPSLTQEIVQRLRKGHVVNLSGDVIGSPPYSKSYDRWLKTVGHRGGPPDFSFTGGMINHISNRISLARGGGIKLVISTYGRVDKTRPKAPRESVTYTRRAYSYWDKRRMQRISVPEQVITSSHANIRADMYAKRKLALDNYAGESGLKYRAHLAWWLGKRAGWGRWTVEQRAHLFGISNEQRERLRDEWMEHLERRGILSVWSTTEISVR
jgi:hypothetical protein